MVITELKRIARYLHIPYNNLVYKDAVLSELVGIDKRKSEKFTVMQFDIPTSLLQHAAKVKCRVCREAISYEKVPMKYCTRVYQLEEISLGW